jgi:hypothetical protein
MEVLLHAMEVLLHAMEVLLHAMEETELDLNTDTSSNKKKIRCMKTSFDF